MSRRAMTWPMRPSPINPTFMAPLLRAELAAHPVDLAADIVDDVAGFEVFRQHVPGIGLDFELPRQRLLLVKAQRVLDGEARRAKLPEIVEENRDVDMDAPLARPRLFLKSGDSVVEIEEAIDLAVPLFHGLGKIDGLGVALERVDDRLRHFRHL